MSYPPTQAQALDTENPDPPLPEIRGRKPAVTGVTKKALPAPTGTKNLVGRPTTKAAAAKKAAAAAAAATAAAATASNILGEARDQGGEGQQESSSELQSVAGNIRRSVRQGPKSSKIPELDGFQEDVIHADELTHAIKRMKKEWADFERNNPPSYVSTESHSFQVERTNRYTFS